MPDVGDPKPRIFVNGREYRGATGSRMTAAEILAFAGLDADRYALVAEGHRGQRLAPEEPVPVLDGARFVALPRDEVG